MSQSWYNESMIWRNVNGSKVAEENGLRYTVAKAVTMYRLTIQPVTGGGYMEKLKDTEAQCVYSAEEYAEYKAGKGSKPYWIAW